MCQFLALLTWKLNYEIVYRYWFPFVFIFLSSKYVQVLRILLNICIHIQQGTNVTVLDFISRFLFFFLKKQNRAWWLNGGSPFPLQHYLFPILFFCNQLSLLLILHVHGFKSLKCLMNIHIHGQRIILLWVFKLFTL